MENHLGEVQAQREEADRRWRSDATQWKTRWLLALALGGAALLAALVEILH